MALTRPVVPKELRNYLIPTERIVFKMHSHWARVFEPVATTAAGFVIFLVIARYAPGSGTLLNILLIGWLVLLMRMLWKLIEWRLEWFLATDRRVMLIHGVVIRKVAMMPLAKVTDMAYNRTPMGALLGYGQFVMESAGQDQALSVVNYVKDPNFYYKTLSAVIFAPPSRRRYDTNVPTSTGTKLPSSEPEEGWWKRG